ncbi:GGDEF domain-containing protein [Marinicella marina]|uniref:GGDEF domain-containing protein n=1 Tax=Marinicella marina TaxID=2996016 RepID=UPI002260AFA6|nr:GGDEF domain-containing protein [Marinicella marina]
MTVWVANAQITSDLAEPVFITDKLLELESKRLSDYELFLDGLSELEQTQGSMSSYQYCHFRFLKAYKVAFEGLTQEAINQMKEIIPSCDDLRARIRIEALVANLSALVGDYENASFFIDAVINKVEQTADIASKVIAYTAASMVYNLLDQKELSIEYSKLLYSLSPTDENLCRLHYSKNLHHLDSDSSKTSMVEIKDIADECSKNGHNLIAESILLDTLKRSLSQAGIDVQELTVVSALIEQLKPLVQNSIYINNKTAFNAIEAKFALLQGDQNKAKVMAEKTLDMNRDADQTEYLVMALKVLETVHREMGDFVNSYHYLERRNEAELGMYDQAQAKQMAFMTIKHSNLSKVFEIEQLNQQKEVLELEKQLAKQEANNQRLIILLILIILSFVILLLMRIKKKHDYFRAVSEIDHLTKVLTRKAFEEQMSVILDESREQKKTVQLAIMDLDHFKVVNDTHGHLVGDWVLKNVVYAVKELIEENMIIARLGGEEFCVVMTDITQEDMHAKLEHMRQSIEQLDCSDSAADLAVTASFGYTSSDISGYALPLLLTHADVALFEAKKQGRNQIVLAHNEH